MRYDLKQSSLCCLFLLFLPAVLERLVLNHSDLKCQKQGATGLSNIPNSAISSDVAELAASSNEAHPARAQNLQMSEAFCTAAFLSLSGGLQDAYTYLARGKVFANAQTGNIIFFSQHLFNRQWAMAARYAIPISAFALGVWVAQAMRYKQPSHPKLHWRHDVLAIEIILLALVGWLPTSLNLLANLLVSFSCAMQVQAFRKVRGYAFASTMCIGNLRSAMEALHHFHRKRERLYGILFLQYLAIIALFASGAALGSFLVQIAGLHSIWFSCLLLTISWLIMLKGQAHS